MKNDTLELYDILTIETEEGDKEFTVANMVLYNDSTYLYLIEVDQEENIIEGNQLIVRRVIKDGEAAVEIVTDEKEKQAVARLFFDLFKDMAHDLMNDEDDAGEKEATSEQE